MTLDLGHLREYMYIASKGVVPQLRLAKEWLAALQAVMISFASVYRFYTNEARLVRNNAGGHVSPMLRTRIVGTMSFVISCVLFCVVCFFLLEGLPGSAARVEAQFPEHLTADVISLQVLVLVWIGYPIVSLVARYAHIGLPGDVYSASISAFKDMAYAALDITSKGGLAVFFILKSSWVPASVESALIVAGNAALNPTES